MIYHGSARTQYPQGNIKQEQYQFPHELYATPAAYNNDVGARRCSESLNSSVRATVNTVRLPASRATLPIAMPGQKRPAPESNGKPIKAEQPEEFSNAVKKRLQSSTRTGQACDRCKVRKIRCDGLPGGCSPCLQNNTECRTTDRITGRATSRGYVEGLEQQNRDLQHRLHELEQRLNQAGLDTKPMNAYQNAGTASYEYNQSAAAASSVGWSPSTPYTTQGSTTPVTAGSHETNVFKSLPAFRAGCHGDNYLGVSPGNSNLSSIKGTALSILGMEIDIADFDSTDMDEPEPSTLHPELYNKSYQAFLQSALNVNPRLERVALPAREQGVNFAEWYFRVLNPYLPILHRPTFLRLLNRVYDDPAFRPTTAETVMVHMVFAIMSFQYAARNWEDSAQHAHLNHQSNMHYHYSMSMFYQLMCSHTVQDVQALTLICAHLRNFPKPGASWILTQTTMSLAIELGLHRSAKRWAPDTIPNPLDVEMRKRTFWAILTIHVTLSGKLGRPMAFRLEDLDVEMPEPVDDDLLSENGLDTSIPGKCSHDIGLQAIRILPLYMELYSTIYAVRRKPETYIETVDRLEAKLRQWRDGLPADLVKGEAGTNEQEGRVFALYTQIWTLEFRLLLRHPSVSMTQDAAFNAESMRICVESSRQMLRVVLQLQKYKSLDTTWYNCAVYVMAITTTLFSQYDKRGDTSAADLAALREEMDRWLEIMGDLGALLGSGNRLRQAVKVVTDGTLGLLSRSLPVKNAGYSQSKIVVKESISPIQRSKPPNTFSNTTQPYYDNAATTATATSMPATTYVSTQPEVAHTQTPYPPSTQYNSNYPEGSSTSVIAYNHQDSSQSYSSYRQTSDVVEAPLLAAFAAQATQLQAQDQSGSWQRTSPHLANSGSMAWHQWANTMADTLEPQDCYSANALMQLGGRDMNESQQGPDSQASAALSHMAAHGQGVGLIEGHIGRHLGGQVQGNNMVQAWPLNIFDIGHSGSQ